MATSISGITTEKCQQSGIYKCVTHSSSDAPITKYETFPLCRKCYGHRTTWVLLTPAY